MAQETPPKPSEPAAIESTAVKLLEGKATLSAQNVGNLVKEIKILFARHKENKYNDELLQHYFHLVGALYNLCLYFDLPQKRNYDKKCEYAQLAEAYLSHFFDKYRLDYLPIISKPGNHLVNYYKLGILYKYRTLLAKLYNSLLIDRLKYFSLSMRMLNFCHGPSQLTKFPDDLKLKLKIHFSELIANFMGSINELIEKMDYTKENIDKVNECFNILTAPVIAEYARITRQQSSTSFMPVLMLVVKEIEEAITFLMPAETACLNANRFDESLNILAWIRTLLIVLCSLEPEQDVDQITAIVDHRTSYNHYMRAAYLLKTDLGSNAISFDVILKYINNSSPMLIDNILLFFNQANRITTRSGYECLNHAYVYENIFREMRETFASTVTSSVLVDLYLLQQRITNFLVSKAQVAYNNSHYLLAENIYYLSLHTLPIVSERPQPSVQIYAQATYLNVQYLLTCCFYAQLLNNRQQQSNLDKKDELQCLNFYLTLLDMLHIVQITPTNLSRAREELLKDDPKLLSELTALEQKSDTLYSKRRALVLHKTLKNISGEERRNLCQELDIANSGLREKIQAKLKDIFDNELTPEQQQYLRKNGLLIFNVQEERSERPLSTP